MIFKVKSPRQPIFTCHDDSNVLRARWPLRGAGARLSLDHREQARAGDDGHEDLRNVMHRILGFELREVAVLGVPGAAVRRATERTCEKDESVQQLCFVLRTMGRPRRWQRPTP